MAIVLQWPFKRVVTQPVVQEKRSAGGLNIPGELFNALFSSDNGEKVSTENASTIASVYHAITIHCNSLNIPINVFKRMPNGDAVQVTSRDDYEYSVHRLLHTSPNLMMTPANWIQLMEMSRLIYGNGYSFIARNKLQVPTALIWIHPNRIEVKTNGRELFYSIKNESGGGYWLEDVPHLDMLHVKATSYDGIMGKSPIDLAKDSLEFGKNALSSGNKFFSSGMRQAVVLTHPGSMSPQGQARLGDQFDKQMKSGKTIVVEEGIRPTTMNFSPEQSQFITSNAFSVTEVARWFNLPESMLENNERSTFSNIEHKTLWFIMNNVRPRVRMYEQEFNWKLLTNYEDYFTEFNINALLRADAATRAQFYVQMVQNGIMSRNEIRKLENLNGIENGDEFMTPLNLAMDSERNQKMQLTTEDTDNGQGNSSE